MEHQDLIVTSRQANFVSIALANNKATMRKIIPIIIQRVCPSMYAAAPFCNAASSCDPGLLFEPVLLPPSPASLLLPHQRNHRGLLLPTAELLQEFSKDREVLQ